jgi:hypothetical protein
MKVYFTFSHINDHYIKINKCIESSKTKSHFEACEKLISNFENLFCTKKCKNKKYTKGLIKNLIHHLSLAKNKFY